MPREICSTCSIAVHDSPRWTFLPWTCLIASEPRNLFATKILVSRCPIFKLHVLWNTSFILSWDFGCNIETLLSLSILEVWGGKVPTGLLSTPGYIPGCCLSEPTRFVGHVVWILCIVRHQVHQNNKFLFPENALVFPDKKSTLHSSSMAGNTSLCKGTYKALTEPFLSLVGLLWHSRGNGVHPVPKDVCGHLVLRSKVSLQSYWPATLGHGVGRKGKKTHCLTARKPKHLPKA